MRAILVGGLAAVLALAIPQLGAAEEHKGAVLKKMSLDLKSKPARRIIVLAVGKDKEINVQFGKDMKAYDLDGKEVPRDNLATVFRVGSTIDVKTAKEGDEEVITEARLVKKGK